ncbi:MAG: hypothetical protein WD768_20595 [Phycisphaeraceae bacterium]
MPEHNNTPATIAPASNADQEDPLWDRRVATMRKAVIPSIVAGAVKLEKHVSPTTIGAYMEDFAHRAGGIDDPIEEVIVRQIAQADLIIGQLLEQTTRAVNALAAQAYGSTACRLISEVRRLALALKKYRNSDEPRKTTIIHQVTHVGQQNIAAKQDVAYSREGNDDADGEGRVSMHSADTKQTSVNKGAHLDDYDRLQLDQPARRSRRYEAAAQA